MYTIDCPRCKFLKTKSEVSFSDQDYNEARQSLFDFQTPLKCEVCDFGILPHKIWAGGQKIFPKICPCCCGLANTTKTITKRTHEGSSYDAPGGKTVTIWFEIPYCAACKRHDIIEMVLRLIFSIPSVCLLLLAGWLVWSGSYLYSAVPGVVAIVLEFLAFYVGGRIGLKYRHGACCPPGGASYKYNWETYTFTFRNPKYAEAFRKAVPNHSNVYVDRSWIAAFKVGLKRFLGY